ncbi:unnamed protein product [Nezara viridula]|uniref:Uncharacterized protein n=1 Tax=Nezara viridula TaxID=85310 RepID=A0A9P0HJS0_NEZVI|nr:unnamed protein product [Nezara viridula]
MCYIRGGGRCGVIGDADKERERRFSQARIDSIIYYVRILINASRWTWDQGRFELRSGDVQCEIENHKEVFGSLNSTGRKLLGSLTSQDDAVMLQRRLDEMNQRWNHLKNKSMAIR